MKPYVVSLLNVISLLVRSICYFQINRHIFYTILFIFVLLCISLVQFCVFPFLCIALYIVSPFVLSLSYFLQVYRLLPFC